MPSILEPHQAKIPVMTPEWLRKLLETPDEPYAVTMLILVMDRYGPEVLDWHPQTLRMELEQDFGIRLPPLNLSKLLAAIDILTSDVFFNRLSRFISYCNVLSGELLQPDEFNPATSEEIAWGVTEALLINPPDEETDQPFSLDILNYVTATLKDEGLIQPPPLLAALTTPDFRADYSGLDEEDPEMFAAQFQLHGERGQTIQTMVQERVQELLQQVGSLPLRNRSEEDDNR